MNEETVFVELFFIFDNIETASSDQVYSSVRCVRARRSSDLAATYYHTREDSQDRHRRIRSGHIIIKCFRLITPQASIVSFQRGTPSRAFLISTLATK